MARIPEHEVERLKSEVSLARLVESLGIVLTRHGANLLGLCPFHEDHEPSLVVSWTRPGATGALYISRYFFGLCGSKRRKRPSTFSRASGRLSLQASYWNRRRCVMHDGKCCGRRPDPTPATLDSAEKGGYPA